MSSSIDFEHLTRTSPKAACQLCFDLLAQDDPSLISDIVAVGGAALLPKDKEEWDGIKGQFWRKALPLDPIQWVKDAFTGLSLSERRDCARILLISSAKAKAFETFDYLLSLGAARRTKTIFDSAYIHGGWKCAKRVKNPTHLEARETLMRGLYRNKSSAYSDAVIHETDGLLWLLGFINPTQPSPADATWACGLIHGQSPEFVLDFIQKFPQFKLPTLTPADAYNIAANLACSGHDEAFFLFCTQNSIPLNAQPPATSNFFIMARNTGSRSDGQSAYIELNPNESLMLPALLSLNSSFCKKLLALGVPALPKSALESCYQRLHAYRQNPFKNHFDSAISMAEALEIGGALSSPTRPGASSRKLSSSL